MPKQVKYTADDYWNLPEGRRAELVDGELYDMAPPNRAHQQIVSNLTRLFGNFIAEHGGPCQVYPAPFAVNLFEDDDTFVEPDVSVICDPSKLSDRGCEGAPDLVVEVVSPSNWRWDYFTKAERYAQAGVREYWIVDPRTQRTTIYRYEQDAPLVGQHPFSEPISVGIWDNALTITIADLLK